MKYSEYDRSAANKIVLVVIAIIAVIAIGAFAKVMIDHISGGNSMLDPAEVCNNPAAVEELNRSGVYQGQKIDCSQYEAGKAQEEQPKE